MSARASVSDPTARKLASRLDTVLRIGQENRAAIQSKAGRSEAPNTRLQDLPIEILEAITMQINTDPEVDRMSLCSRLEAWCRKMPDACKSTNVWREAFSALINIRIPGKEHFHKDVPEFDPEMYKKIFAETCRLLDKIRNGDTAAYDKLHVSLRGSPNFVRAAVGLNVSVIPRISSFVLDPQLRAQREEIVYEALLENAQAARYIKRYDLFKNKQDPLVGGYIDEERVYGAIWENPEILLYIPEDYDLDYDQAEILTMVDENPEMLQYVKRYQDDKNIVLTLVESNPEVLQWASQRLRADK